MFEHYSVADFVCKIFTKNEKQNILALIALFCSLLLYHLQLKQLRIKILSKTQQVIQLISAIKSPLQKIQLKRF